MNNLLPWRRVLSAKALAALWMGSRIVVESPSPEILGPKSFIKSIILTKGFETVSPVSFSELLPELMGQRLKGLKVRLLCDASTSWILQEDPSFRE